jgi:hypothetical protein
MIIREKTDIDQFGEFAKIVADLKRGVISAGCELHIDCADELVQDGSSRDDLWGANIYPTKKQIAFISLINISPARGNRSMEIKLPEVRGKVEKIIRTIFPSL